MGLDKIFEDTVFGKMSQGQKQIKHTAIHEDVNFEERVAAGLLNFDSLRAADKGARVMAVGGSFDIRLKRNYKALDLAQLIGQDNAGVELKFDSDMIGFNPDEDMLFKSKIPLWIIKPISNNRVLITRAW